MRAPSDGPVAGEARQLDRFTFWINFLDLALFWGGDAFASVAIVLPLFVSRLTDSPLAIGLVPTLFSVGYVVPQLIAAGYVQRLRLKRPFALRAYGIQRLALFCLAGATLLLGRSAPDLLLGAFFVIFTIGSCGMGAGIPTHQDVIAKVVPPASRGRLRGWGIFTASLLGVAAGFVARGITETVSFPESFALCFAIAATLGTASLGFIALNREPPGVVLSEVRSPVAYLKSLPRTLRADHNFRTFLVARIVFSAASLAAPFLPVYALARFALPPSAMGTLTAALMGGQTLAVLGFGFLADRHGHKLVLVCGGLALAAALGLMLLATAPATAFGAFALTGVSNAAVQISGIYAVLEFAPAAQRPTYVALSSTLVAPVTILAPLLGSLVVVSLGYGWLFALSLGPALLSAGILAAFVREPRYLKADAPSRSGMGTG